MKPKYLSSYLQSRTNEANPDPFVAAPVAILYFLRISKYVIHLEVI